MEAELEKAKEHATSMAKVGLTTTTEPVAPANTQTPNELVGSMAPINNNGREQEICTLKEKGNRRKQPRRRGGKWKKHSGRLKRTMTGQKKKEKNCCRKKTSSGEWRKVRSTD